MISHLYCAVRSRRGEKLEGAFHNFHVEAFILFVVNCPFIFYGRDAFLFRFNNLLFFRQLLLNFF